MNSLRQSVQLLCQAVKQLLRQWTEPDNHTLILNIALDLTRSKSELVLENTLFPTTTDWQRRQIAARFQAPRRPG